MTRTWCCSKLTPCSMRQRPARELRGRRSPRSSLGPQLSEKGRDHWLDQTQPPIVEGALERVAEFSAGAQGED